MPRCPRCSRASSRHRRPGSLSSGAARAQSGGADPRARHAQGCQSHRSPAPDGSRSVLHAPRILLATGSRPRHVPAIQVDHEHILDSDSIFSLSTICRDPDRSRERRHRLRIRLDLRGARLLRDLARQGSGAAGISGRASAGGVSRRVPLDGRHVPRRRGGHGRALRRLLAGRGVARGRGHADRGHRLRAFGRIANLDGIGLDRLDKIRNWKTAPGHALINKRLKLLPST